MGEGDFGRWVDALKVKMESGTGTIPKWSMYEVPPKLRSTSLSPYEPCAISIGPFHHGGAGLLGDMENTKWRYMASLLKRNRRHGPEETLRSCARFVLSIETRVRDCYGGRISFSGDMAKLVLVDGCFILELLIRSYAADRGARPNMGELRDDSIFQRDSSDTTTDDPLLNLPWFQSMLRRDLALLENQIPWFILESLFHKIAGHDTDLPHDFLATMAFNFFRPLLQHSCWGQPAAAQPRHGERRTHLLHLLLNTYLQLQPQAGDDHDMQQQDATAIILDIDGTMPRKAFNIRGATELRDGGIAFQVAPPDQRDLLDLRFSNGVFEIPQLHLTEDTISFLRNLMAFELCLPDHQQQIVGSYVVFMSHLMQRPEDVSFLETKGIVVNELGNGLGVCLVFHSMVTDNFPIRGFCFEKLSNKVEAHFLFCRSLAEQLKRGYVPTRWGNVRFLAAYLLLLFVELIMFAGLFFLLSIAFGFSLLLSFAAFLYIFQSLNRLLRTEYVRITEREVAN